MKKLCLLAVLAVFWAGCKSEDTTTPTSTSEGPGGPVATPTFASVQPIFNQRCIACHGENGKDGVDLRTYESVMKGGKEGPIVKAGDAKGSLLVQIVQAGHAKRMPFKQDPLADEQIEQIERWVTSGAKG